MIGESIGHQLQTVGIDALERVAHYAVKGRAFGHRQAVVDDLLCEHVFEPICRLVGLEVFDKKLVFNQDIERRLHISRSQYRLENSDSHATPEHRVHLQHLPWIMIELIDATKHRLLNRGGKGELTGVFETFGYGTNQLLEEEWVAIRYLDNACL